MEGGGDEENLLNLRIQMSKFLTNWATKNYKLKYCCFIKLFSKMIRAELWDGLLWMFAEEIGWEGGFEEVWLVIKGACRNFKTKITMISQNEDLWNHCNL